MDEQLAPFFLIVRQEMATKGLISAFCVIRKQQALLGGNDPQFIMSIADLDITLSKMKEFAERAISMGRALLQRMRAKSDRVPESLSGATARERSLTQKGVEAERSESSDDDAGSDDKPNEQLVGIWQDIANLKLLSA
ncbi:hypothetical protein HDZ31DRAFT_71736 [Schizophyllum fasciatum]